MISALYIVPLCCLGLYTACHLTHNHFILKHINKNCTTPLAPDLPSGDQFRHVQELSETSDETVTLHKEVPPAGKPLPPMLISDSLPPAPAKLVKKSQEGQFIKMAELLTDALISPYYVTEDDPISHKQKRK